MGIKAAVWPLNKKGKIQAKSSGTAKVTATVTMKNGQKKKIKMKVKVL